jgi:hypothetical protein
MVDDNSASRVERHVECLRCGLSIAVSCDGQSVNYAYDVEPWRTKCCCSHLHGPSACCSFLALEDIINTCCPDLRSVRKPFGRPS